MGKRVLPGTRPGCDAEDLVAGDEATPFTIHGPDTSDEWQPPFRRWSSLHGRGGGLLRCGNAGGPTGNLLRCLGLKATSSVGREARPHPRGAATSPDLPQGKCRDSLARFPFRSGYESAVGL